MRFFQRFIKKSEHPEITTYIRKHLGFTTNNTSVYNLAFTHSSVADTDEHGTRLSNERLEYLGDAILDAIVADYLYSTFPKMQEGELTKMKSKIVSRKNLNAIGYSLQLLDILEINVGGQEIHPTIIGNAFEALIGAVYLDKGHAFTNKIFLKILKKYGLSQKVHDDVDFKSKLHEWCQKEKKSLRFAVIHESQEKGLTKYIIEVIVDGKKIGLGEGKSKKAAEQSAAKEACEHIFKK